VTRHVVDVRDREAVYRYARDVEQQHGGADVIINNAGLTVRATLEEVSYEDFELVIDVNMWGVVYGAKAFLPLLRKRPEGHIVNISSINAMVPFAKNGPYNISKYAVLGLSETLVKSSRRADPRELRPPGGIRRTSSATHGARAAAMRRCSTGSRGPAPRSGRGDRRGRREEQEQIFVASTPRRSPRQNGSCPLDRPPHGGSHEAPRSR